MIRTDNYGISRTKLIDSCGRKINYLRISVTERCNMRCTYCMPENSSKKNVPGHYLSFSQFETLVRSAVQIGIEKVRITGGEPLLRPGLIDFLCRIGKIEGLERLVITTNGLLLPYLARDLASSGVHSLNISLDSLNVDTFKSITGGADLSTVIKGIDAALNVGLRVKLNMVPMRGINDHEIIRMVNFASQRGIGLRFIEYMPVYRPLNWQEKIISGTEILNLLMNNFDLAEQGRSPLDGPANNYQLIGKNVTVGLISPVYEHICSACNRIRITSKGRMRSCLFSDHELDLIPLLESGEDADLMQIMKNFIIHKPVSHHLHEKNQNYSSFSMAAIGG